MKNINEFKLKIESTSEALDIFSENEIRKFVSSHRMLDLVRGITRSIYKDLRDNKVITVAFNKLEKEFNHKEFQYY